MMPAVGPVPTGPCSKLFQDGLEAALRLCTLYISGQASQTGTNGHLAAVTGLSAAARVLPHSEAALALDGSPIKLSDEAILILEKVTQMIRDSQSSFKPFIRVPHTLRLID